MTVKEVLVVFFTALLGGSGVVGLITWAIKRKIEGNAKHRQEEAQKKEETRQKIEQLLEHNEEVNARLDAMAAENTLQCYCLLAALRGLEEQGCDGPVKDGINRLEKYLNKKAHGVA